MGGSSRLFNECGLEPAFRCNDVRLVSLLLKHNVCPKSLVGVQTAEMAQLFIDNGVNIRETPILWDIVNSNQYSVEILKFYLKNGANVQELNSDKASLLHKLASVNVIHNFTMQINAPTRYDCNKFDDSLLKKGELLLNAIPNMINAVNKQGQTPIDVAQQSLKKVEESGNTQAIVVLKQLIELFRNYDGLTAQELAPLK